MANKFVVVGGGVSAGYFARAFVEKGFPKGSLVMVSSDIVLPYERPALSKGYLIDPETRYPKFQTCVGVGEAAQNEAWYQRHGIEVYLNTVVQSIDLSEKKLKTSIGDIPFHKLILATGSDNIKPDWPGNNLPGVHVLRELSDADALLSSFEHARRTGGRAVIVGGGYIGLETASACVQNNIPTTMIFPNDYLMHPFLPKDVGLQYEQLYVEKGIEIRKFTSVVGFKPSEDGSRVKCVCLDNGEEIECAFAIVGIGARPRTKLFRDLLEMHDTRGVKVDKHLRTSHPDVYAMGDIASFPDTVYNEGEHFRVEHVDNARKQGEHLADVLHAKEFGGEMRAYRYLPYFYSREFDKSWKFYGRQKGSCYIAGSLFEPENGFTTVWLDDENYLQGVLAESARDDEFALLKDAADVQVQLNAQEIATARCGKDVIFLIRDAMRDDNPNKKTRPTIGQRIADFGKSAQSMLSKVTEKISGTS